MEAVALTESEYQNDLHIRVKIEELEMENKEEE